MRSHLPIIALAILLLGAAVFTAVADRTTALNLVYRAQDAHSHGRFPEAEKLSDDALAYASKQYGEESSRVADILELRGTIYSDQHKYELAEQEYLKAKILRQNLSGVESQEYGHVCELLGTFYTDRGKFAEAEANLQRALAIVQKSKTSKSEDSDMLANLIEGLKGPQDPAEARLMSELAWLYSKQGQYPRAEQLYKQAMSVREKVLSPTHPAVRANAEDLRLLESLQRKY